MKIILEQPDIDKLKEIISNTLNRHNLTNADVIDYWNDIDISIQCNAYMVGIGRTKYDIIDFLEENFPKHDE